MSMHWTFTDVALNDFSCIALSDTVVKSFPAILCQLDLRSMIGGTLCALFVEECKILKKKTEDCDKRYRRWRQYDYGVEVPPPPLI